MSRFLHEYRHFLSYPHAMRVLLVTNLIYAFVLPVIDIFVGAYVMRNSNDVKMVVSYQLAVYTGIPFTFLLNGILLRRVAIKWLYSLGMLLSGVSMMFMMSLSQLSLAGVTTAGFIMGMSFGLFWANRDFLVLTTTDDANRNYYYGLETFFYTNTYVVVPMAIGWFIAGAGNYEWFGGANGAYQIVTGCVLLLTIVASVVVQRGAFQNPPSKPFLFWRYHRLWNQMLVLAVLKGLTQGYIVTAPAMLVMMLVGGEGALGTLQAVGGIVSAFLLYWIGRTTRPAHRLAIFALGLVLFLLGGLANALLFDAAGVLVFMMCLLLARPLHDLAYFPIQMRVIDVVSAIESRNQFAYIMNHEFGLYVGRFVGCSLFIVLASALSEVFALRFALAIVGGLQLLSWWIARDIVRGCESPDLPVSPMLPAPIDGVTPASAEYSTGANLHG